MTVLEKIKSKNFEYKDYKGFRQIEINALVLDSVIDFDLYFYNREKDAFVLYKSRNFPYTQHINDRILYIKIIDMSDYMNYLIKHIKLLGMHLDIEFTQKFSYYYNIIKQIMHIVFVEFEKYNLPELLKDITDSAYYLFSNYKINLKYVLENMTADYSLYTHSINVSFYSINYAFNTGLSKEQIESLCIGGLLHDIGKKKIKHSILFSQKSLTDSEYKEIQKHPLYGYNMIKGIRKFSDDILKIIKYHHEKYDGSGYPEQLAGEDIPYLTRIVNIADFFDRLTSNLYHNTAVSSYKAFQIMKNEMNNCFEEKMLNNFIKMFTYK